MNVNPAPSPTLGGEPQPIPLEMDRHPVYTRAFTYAAGMTLGVAFAVLLFALQYQERDRDLAEIALKTEAASLAARLENDINLRIPSLKRMVARWVDRNGTPRREWEQDATNYINDFPGYQAIEWVDSSFRVRWVVPHAGNEATIGRDLGENPRWREALQRARATGKPTTSPPIALEQGGKEFSIYFPLYTDRFDGAVVAVFEVGQWASRLMLSDEPGNVVSRLYFGQELLHESGQASGSGELSIRALVNILDHQWELHLSANRAYVANRASPLTRWFLLGGFGLSVLIGLVTYSWLTASRNVRSIDEHRALLRQEISHHRKTAAERDRAMHVMQTEQTRLRSIVDHLPLGVALWDENDRLEAWNERYTDFHKEVSGLIREGVHIEEIIRAVASARVEEGVAADEEQYVRDRLALRQNPRSPIMRYRSDGSVYVLLDIPIFPGGMLETFEDVSELYAVREEVAARTRLLQSLIDVVPVGLAYFNEQDRLTLWNDTYLDMFPELSELVTHHPTFEDCYREVLQKLGISVDDREFVVRERMAKHNSLEPVKEFDYSTADDRRLLVQENLLARGASLITFTDVTPLYLRETELRRSNQELEQFAYIASHDLQEPLRMVASYTDLIRHRYAEQLDDDARDYIAHAVNGAQRMKSLIQDLLAYSRLHKKLEEPAEVSLDAVIERVTQRLDALIERTGAKVEVASLPTVLGHEPRLVQLFQNLVENGIKYCGDNRPVIEIDARSSGRFCEVSVKDNGIGIEAKHHEQIFAPFKRLHRFDEVPGNGIGLALCDRIARQHNGNLRIESSPGMGTTMIVALELSRD